MVEVPVTLRDSVRGLWASFRDDDDRWADLAREVPGGFAGMMLEGGLVVFLVDTTQRDAALGALAARGALGGRDPRRVRVRKARWDFSQLIDWYHYLNLHVWHDRVVESDIDEEHNRITYGVMGEAARRQLDRQLAALRPPPPCFLVAIEVVGPPPEKAVTRVPARLASNRDTARVILPDTVPRGSEFPMTVWTFGGGCIREAADSRVSVHGLRARVTLYHMRRLLTAVCTSDLIQFPQTVRLRFDKAGVATIEIRGVTNELEWDPVTPSWIVLERHVVVR